MRPVAESKVVVVVVVLEVVAAVKAELDLIAGLVVVVVTSVVVMVVFVLDNNRLGRIKFDRSVLGWSVSGISDGSFVRVLVHWGSVIVHRWWGRGWVMMRWGVVAVVVDRWRRAVGRYSSFGIVMLLW